MTRLPSLALVAASLTALSLVGEVPRHPKFGFPVYTNAPSGRQLSGQHKPADNPAYSPEEARKRFTLFGLRGAALRVGARGGEPRGHDLG